MLKYLFIILLCISGGAAMAQDTDSLLAIHKGATWAIRYVVKPGESISMLAHRFYMTENMLAASNEMEANKRLTPGEAINIPVTRDNYFVSKQPLDGLQELYYHVVNKDDIGLLSTYAGVTKTQMRNWNNLKGNTLVPGEALFIGWVKMIVRDTANPITFNAYPAVKKIKLADTSSKVIVLGGLDTAYNRQTNNGTNVLTEKGTAVFFDKPGKNNVFYAFHNSTPHGSIIKIYNPGTGKTIYAKVLDKVPDTKLYSNSIIGLSTPAKEALGVNNNKAWVEISYSTN